MDEYRVEDNIVEQVDQNSETAYATLSSGLTFGIIACALAEWPFASIAAIILGAMGKRKVEEATNYYLSRGLEVPKKRIPARITTLAGFIGGIVMTVFWTIYILAICTCVAGSAMYY